MSVRAKLIAVHRSADPAGIVLVVHGGGSRKSRQTIRSSQLAVLRTVPLARRIAHAGKGTLAVFRMLNSARGWDGEQSPVDDIVWALSQLREHHRDGLPIGLVGHSLGGRAAVLAGGNEGVRAVAALAPWVYPADGDVDLSGRAVLIVHGDRDRVADPAKSLAVAEGLRRTATVIYRPVAGGTHSMLRHRAQFDGVAGDFMATTLLGQEPTNRLRGESACGSA